MSTFVFVSIFSMLGLGVISLWSVTIAFRNATQLKPFFIPIFLFAFTGVLAAALVVFDLLFTVYHLIFGLSYMLSIVTTIIGYLKYGFEE